MVAGFGAERLKGPDQSAPVEGGEVEAGRVGGVDPGEVVATAGDRPADPEAEGDEHRLQGAAGAVEDDARPHSRDPQAELLGGLRLALPGDADLGEKVVGGRGVLVDGLVSVGAVVARRGGRDQRVGPVFHGAQSRDEVARPPLAARADALLGGRGPALVDGLPGQVDDGVTAGERAGRRGLGLGVPALACTPSLSRAPSGPRERTVTSSPRSFSAATMRCPTRPVAPVTVTLML